MKNNVRDHIIQGKNPKDEACNFIHITQSLYKIIYTQFRKKHSLIPKKSLHDEIFVVIVEGFADKRLWEDFVTEKTVIERLRIPEENDKPSFCSGKQMIQKIFSIANLQKYPYNSLVKDIKRNRVIGIIDKDTESFSEITKNSGQNIYKPDKYQNLFVTETTDTDTFILQYCGFCIFLHFLADLTSDYPNKKMKLFNKILDEAELLGYIFKAREDGLLKFKQIDGESIENLSMAFNQKLPTCEIFKMLIKYHTNQKKIEENPLIISKFVKRFIKEKQKPSARNSENFLLDCRGHSIMQVLCSHSAKQIKDDFKDDIPEHVLSNKIYEFFHHQNSVRKSKLFLSLLSWEQYNEANFLKKL
jgi:hypothetical protein